MPRKPRLYVPGGIYHTILRGNNRGALFFDTADRDTWEALLADGLVRYRCRVHAYCWMTNHLHLAVQVADEPLGRLIQWVGSKLRQGVESTLPAQRPCIRTPPPGDSGQS